MKPRRSHVARGVVLVVAFGCGSDSGEGQTSFGSQTSTDGSTSSTTSGTTSTASSTTAGTSGATTEGDTSTSTSSGTTAAGSSTGDDGTGSASMGASTGSTSTASSSETAGGAELGDCVGLGAWPHCDAYCAAILQSCVPGGCDGATIVYYGDINDCNAQADGSPDAQACDEALSMAGGNSFGRCCCG